MLNIQVISLSSMRLVNMKVLNSENYIINVPKKLHSKGVTSEKSFKTILGDNIFTKCKTYSTEKKDLSFINTEKKISLCGIDSIEEDCNNSIEKGILTEENDGKISSCYECEVKDECPRFKNDKTDILMDMNITLTTKYDYISKKYIPIGPFQTSEKDDLLYHLSALSKSFYFEEKNKKSKFDKEDKDEIVI